MQVRPKRFRAYWSNDFCNPGTRKVSESFFSAELCYSVADIETIAALKIGEKWSSVHYGSAHTVTRIS